MIQTHPGSTDGNGPCAGKLDPALTLGDLRHRWRQHLRHGMSNLFATWGHGLHGGWQDWGEGWWKRWNRAPRVHQTSSTSQLQAHQRHGSSLLQTTAIKYHRTQHTDKSSIRMTQHHTTSCSRQGRTIHPTDTRTPHEHEHAHKYNQKQRPRHKRNPKQKTQTKTEDADTSTIADTDVNADTIADTNQTQAQAQAQTRQGNSKVSLSTDQQQKCVEEHIQRTRGCRQNRTKVRSSNSKAKFRVQQELAECELSRDAQKLVKVTQSSGFDERKNPTGHRITRVSSLERRYLRWSKKERKNGWPQNSASESTHTPTNWSNQSLILCLSTSGTIHDHALHNE